MCGSNRYPDTLACWPANPSPSWAHHRLAKALKRGWLQMMHLKGVCLSAGCKKAHSSEEELKDRNSPLWHLHGPSLNLRYNRRRVSGPCSSQPGGPQLPWSLHCSRWPLRCRRHSTTPWNPQKCRPIVGPPPRLHTPKIYWSAQSTPVKHWVKAGLQLMDPSLVADGRATRKVKAWDIACSSEV